MTTQDIEKLKDLCEKEGFEITIESETQGMFHIEKKVMPIKVRIELMQTDSCDRTVLRFSSNRAVEIKDQWEFFNHIEESIEAFLNRKP